jgi:hypothetical protein
MRHLGTAIRSEFTSCSNLQLDNATIRGNFINAANNSPRQHPYHTCQRFALLSRDAASQLRSTNQKTVGLKGTSPDSQHLA